MKLYHWKSPGVDLLIVAESEDSARTTTLENIAAWRWQNPERFDALATDVIGPPYYIAEPGHPIAIDSLAR